MKTQQKAYIALTATSLIWGTTWVAMKYGVQLMPPLELAALRQFIGGSIFIIFFLIKKEKLPNLQQLKQLFILSIFTFVLANGLSTWSLNYIPSGLASLIGALYPLCVVLIEYFFFRNKNLNTLTVVGILLGLIGICFVMYETAFNTHPAGYIFGLILAIVAMLSWSYSSIMIAQQKIKFNPYFGMGWQLIFASVTMTIISLLFGKNITLTQIPLKAWIAIVYLIIAGSIVAIIAFIYSMKHLPASIASLYAYINPIVAISIGAIVLNEKVTINFIVGTMITLLGVYLVNKAFKKQHLKNKIIAEVEH